MRKPNKKTEYQCACGKKFFLKKKTSSIPRCSKCLYRDARKRAKSVVYHKKEKYREDQHTRRLKNEYGISKETYNKMLEQQGKVCAVCRCADFRHRLCVDHNHQTGDLRGLLCHRCNRGLGILKDDVNVLYDFIKYLSKYDIQHQPL